MLGRCFPPPGRAVGVSDSWASGTFCVSLLTLVAAGKHMPSAQSVGCPSARAPSHSTADGGLKQQTFKFSVLEARARDQGQGKVALS